ncbi:EscI/YscI/HrpB family type III secretion system inner rod protein [Endozoicomonas sp. ALD040]|uniref:EscI/YscI/HrpB family type III secretion system inner rod protein n=1 Tax=unclassified Endozoicomonas TaxID=2644528 RepID=UPI003BAF41EB
MAENIINSKGLTEKALESAETFAVPEKVDAGAADKFGNLLSGDADGQQAIQAASAVGQPEGGALTLGDKILRGMQGLREHVEAGKENVVSNLQPGETMTMQDMFKTQMAMTNLMVTEDYIGKIVSKSTQTFDTLLRNQ